MASNSRKGLRRFGMRRYIIAGPCRTIFIERERPWRFIVYPVESHHEPRGGFFEMKFRKLRAARELAEEMAGLR